MLTSSCRSPAYRSDTKAGGCRYRGPGRPPHHRGQAGVRTNISMSSATPLDDNSTLSSAWSSLTSSQRAVVEYGISSFSSSCLSTQNISKTDDYYPTETLNTVPHPQRSDMLVTGAPGTGKTHCLTHRVARLLHAGTSASRILALTPSESSTNILHHRMDAVVPLSYNDVQVMSFRELCIDILRDFAVELGVSDLHVSGEVESDMFLRKTLFSLPLDRYRPGSNPERILHALATCFATLHRCGITPSYMSNHAHSLRARFQEQQQQQQQQQEKDNNGFQSSYLSEDHVCQQEEIARVFSQYYELKRDRDMIESAEVPSLLIERLRSRPHAAEEVRSMFDHVMVEHLEDLFPVHSEFLPFLGSRSVVAFGDDDTAMLEFMEGMSGTRSFTAFASSFPSAAVHTLTTPFRTSSSQIRTALRRLISFNPNRLETEFGINKNYRMSENDDVNQDITETGEMKDVEYTCHHSHTSEMESLATRIRDVLSTSHPLPSIAVLTRYSADALRIGDGLRDQGIDVWMAGARQLMERPEIKTLLSLLTLSVDPNHSQAANTLLVSFPFSLPKLMVLKITAQSSIADSLDSLSNNNSIAASIQSKAADAAATIRNLRQQAKNYSALEILSRFLTRPSLHSIYTDPSTQEHATAALNIFKFLNLVESAQSVLKRSSVEDIVPYLNMLRQRGVEESTNDAPEFSAVHVMSMHKAKGREYDYVFIPGANDSVLPGIRRRKDIPVDSELTGLPAGSRETHVQAERRIMYTAMSRARKRVFISSNLSKDKFQFSSKKLNPSRFVAESLALPKKAILHSIPTENCEQSYSHNSSAVPKPQEAANVFTNEGMEPTQNELEKICSNLTFEHIQEYNTCPLRFKYLFFHQLPSTFSWSKNYEKAITSSIEKCDQYIKQHGFLPDKEMTESFLKENWVSWGYLSKEHEQDRFIYAKEILTSFILREKNKKPCHKRNIPFFVDLSNASISGKWSRIHEYNNEIQITHFKPSISKTRLKSKPKSNFILLFNTLAYEKLTGVSVSNSNLESIETGERIKYIPQKKDVIEAEKTIHEISNEIKLGKFTPKPTRWNCRQCDFRSICPSAT